MLHTIYTGNEFDETLGYIAEEPRGLLTMFFRQLFRTHRPFRALVMDEAGSPILWVRLLLSSSGSYFLREKSIRV